MQKHLRLFIFIVSILFMTSFADAAETAPKLSGPELGWILNAYSSLYVAEQVDAPRNGAPAIAATAETTAEDSRLFNEAIDRFYKEMQEPSWDDEAVKGLVANLKATGHAY